MNEEKDLEVMRNDVKEAKISFANYCISLSNMSAEDLKMAGYKSVEQALLASVTRLKEKVNSIYAAHVKKYPD